MDSVGLGQSWEEIKEESRSKMVCENCKKLKAEVDSLERRNDELEDEIQGIKDDPSELLENYAGELD